VESNLGGNYFSGNYFFVGNYFFGGNYFYYFSVEKFEV
jgi:hypothetical protein